jgi:hypothetical protein
MLFQYSVIESSHTQASSSRSLLCKATAIYEILLNG